MSRLIKDTLKANFTPTKPGRALDSTFQPSATRPVQVAYTVHLNTGSVAPGANAEAKVELFTGTTDPPTLRRDVASVKVTRSALTTGTHANENDVELSCLVPRGHNVRLVTTLTGAASAVLAEEDEVVL